MNNPTILWAQDRSNIFVTIEIQDLQSHDISFETKKILLKGSNNTNEYNFEIDLNSSIIIEKSSWQIKSNCVKIILVKELNKFWNRLTKVKQNNVKIDWQKWVNEDDSDDSDISEPLLNDFTDFKKTLPSELLEKDFSEFLPDDLGFDGGAEETSESFEDSKNNLNLTSIDNIECEELNINQLNLDLDNNDKKSN